MEYNRPANLILENARIIFRNFSGKETAYNREGNRNFSVIIEDPDIVNSLMDEGWNVRQLAPRDGDDIPTYYLPVAVSFRNENMLPKVYMVTKRNRTLLDIENIGMLDYVEIQNVDLTIRPYHWEVSGRSGTKAYLKTAYITIVEDEWADKYAEEEYPFK